MRVIYFWIQSDLDWQDEEAFWAQVPPGLKPRVDLVDSTFNMPFHIFRHRARDRGAQPLARRGRRGLGRVGRDPSVARVVPVDDDDWFAPNVGQVLEREWGCFSGFLARDVARDSIGPRPLGLHGPSRGLPFPPRSAPATRTTTVWSRPRGTSRCSRRAAATEWFDGPGRDRVKQGVGQRLSVVNRTLRLAQRAAPSGGGPAS